MLCFLTKIVLHAVQKRREKGQRFKISHFYGSFSNDIMAVKGLSSLLGISHLTQNICAKICIYGCDCEPVQARRACQYVSLARASRRYLSLSLCCLLAHGTHILQDSYGGENLRQHCFRGPPCPVWEWDHASTLSTALSASRIPSPFEVVSASALIG